MTNCPSWNVDGRLDKSVVSSRIYDVGDSALIM